MYRLNVKHLIVTLFSSLLLSCNSEAPNPPICRIDAVHLDVTAGNAGCIIRVGQRLLTIKHRLSGKLDTPGGGGDENESAQCTAHRETWEETGFNVEVGPLLGIAKNGFRYYQCQLDDDFGGELFEFPVPEWSHSEVNGIQLIEPFSTTHKQWRHPDRLVNLRSMFVEAGKSEQTTTDSD
ncbi:MAG: NUDIX hydrolase [Aestuariibacter sp.]